MVGPMSASWHVKKMHAAEPLGLEIAEGFEKLCHLWEFAAHFHVRGKKKGRDNQIREWLYCTLSEPESDWRVVGGGPRSPSFVMLGPRVFFVGGVQCQSQFSSCLSIPKFACAVHSSCLPGHPPIPTSPHTRSPCHQQQEDSSGNPTRPECWAQVNCPDAVHGHATDSDRMCGYRRTHGLPPG